MSNETDAAGRAGDAPRSVVLLIDDQPIVVEAIRRMLADETDIQFFSCTDVALALPRARSIRPTVILQDLVMPGVDGFTLVRFFRADPETAAIPIIVLSSKEEARDKSRAFEIGASDYLVKIPDRIELLARIRAHSRSFLAQRERDEAYRVLEELKRELETKNAELARLSVLDGLTGLANRRRLDEVLDAECRRAQREKTSLSLLMTDVDFFKKYNDTYGHQAGDDCLRRVAAALAVALHRPGDVAARYGGEEFAVVLPGTDRLGACKVAEAIRSAVEEQQIQHSASGVAPHVTLSVGVATMQSSEGLDPKSLIQRADSALYSSKHNGRNRWTAFDSATPGPSAD